MRITFLNQKGGVGKTTVALLIAGILRQAGIDVSIDDQDPQGSARFFAKQADVPLYDRENPTRIVITDTAGNLQLDGDAGAALADIIAASDKLILVTEKSPPAIHGSHPMVEFIKSQKQPAASARVLFNRVRAGTSIGQQAGDEIAHHLGLPALKNELPLSSAYENALAAGLSAVTGKRRTELLQLALEVTNK